MIDAAKNRSEKKEINHYHHGLIKIPFEHQLRSREEAWKNFLERNNFVELQEKEELLKMWEPLKRYAFLKEACRHLSYPMIRSKKK